MKILLINPSEITLPGGVHKVVRELGRYLSIWGHEVTVLQLNPSKLKGEEVYNGFRIIRVNSREFYGLSVSAIRYLSRLLSQLSPDIVHVHGYHTLFSPISMWVIKKVRPNTPVVFSPHYMPQGHATLLGDIAWPLYNLLNNKFVFPIIDHIVVASKFEKDSLLRDIPSSRSVDLTIIPHGVDSIISKRTVKIHNRGEIVLLFAGYLQKRKGVQFIIKTLHELVYERGIKNVVLKIIGEGEYKRELMMLAEKLNVSAFIKWHPFVPTREDLLEELKNADILLLLSKNENYGIIVAEALAMGTPVIVTNHSALSEFLSERGCFGVRYPPSPRDVANLILEIINNPVRVGPFTKKIRTWDKVIKDYERLYFSLVVRNENT